MDRKSTIIGGIVGTVWPVQSVIVAQATSPAAHSWPESIVAYNLIGGALVTTVTVLLLIRRFVKHAYNDWLSIRAARKAAAKLEQDLVVKLKAPAAPEIPAVTIETIHPPKV